MARLAAVPDTPRRACLYARVSMVGGREEIISPDVQIHAGRDRATVGAWSVAEEIVELDASGRTFARAGVRRAIEGVETGAWEIVAVYRYDRFGRNARDSLVNIARVEAAGGEVVSCTEPFDAQTAIGKYGRTNLLAVAELQSDIIGENWKAAHARRISRGLPHGGQRRLGYRYVDKHYEPDPDWAPVVAETYRRFIAGDGLHSIAAWLNSLGAPTRSPRSGGWTHAGVTSMLRTGFAAGFLRRRGEYLPGAHEPVIDRRTWAAYQRAAAERAGRAKRHNLPATPISGVLRCGHCGAKMRAVADKAYGPAYTYACTDRDCAGRPYVVRRRVEAAIFTELRLLDADVTTRAAAKVAASAHRSVARAERAALSREITRLDRALVKLAKETGTLPEPVYRQAVAELVAEREAAAARLDALGAETKAAPPSRAMVRGLLRDWDELAVVRRRDMLAAMFHVTATRTEAGVVVDVRGRWED